MRESADETTIDPARSDEPENAKVERSTGSSGSSGGGKRPRRRGWTPSRTLIGIVAALFFLGPLAAGALGVRATAIENRALVPFPSLSEGWDAVDELDQWAIDHLPFRDKAVEFNSALSERVFDELPSYDGHTPDDPGSGVQPGVVAQGAGSQNSQDAQNAGSNRSKVFEGRDDWLYLTEDVTNMCDPVHSVNEMIDNVNRFAQIVERSGARMITAVPPDKATVETENLPDDFPGADCGPAAKRAFWDRYNSAPPDGAVDLYHPLMDLRAERGEPIWRPQGSHWAPIASATYAESLARAVDPALLTGTEVVSTGQTSDTSDLSSMLGAPSPTYFEGYDVRRSGVTVNHWEPGSYGDLGMAVYNNTTTDAPLYQGTVTIIGDSYTKIASINQITPYFSDLRVISLYSTPNNIEDMAAAIADSDVVIMETVERYFASGRVPIYDDAHLDEFDQAMDRVLADR